MLMYNSTLSAIRQFCDQMDSSPGYDYNCLSGTGPVAEFETMLANFYGKRHCLCVSSATSGLMYLQIAAGAVGSEIISTPLSYGGTIAGSLLLGNDIRFADIEPDGLNIDPESVEVILKKHRRKVKAVIAVDYAGIPHNDACLAEVCRRYGVHYFCDSAQSLGAEHDGGKAGVHADAIVLSFGSGKTLYTGEGGAIVTDDESLYRRLVMICQHPNRQKRDCGLEMVSEFSLNGRMNPISAAVGRATFNEAVERLRAHQHRMLGIYSDLQQCCPFRQGFDKGTIPSFFMNPMIVEDPDSFFKASADYCSANDLEIERALVKLLPEQLLCSDHARQMKAYAVPNAGRLKDILYLLKPVYSQS